MRIAIVYDTKMGSTKKVAEYMAEALRSLGHQVEVLRVSQASDVEAFEAFVIGAPVYFEAPLKSVRLWIEAHRDLLRNRPVCLFVVCMAKMSGHLGKEYVNRRYLGMLRKVLGREPEHQGEVVGYILKEPPWTKEDAFRIAKEAVSAFESARGSKHVER